MNSAKISVKTISKARFLTATDFQRLADVPPEVEWFKSFRNLNTKRAYQNAIKDFMLFIGIQHPQEFRIITRTHVIAWRDALGEKTLNGTTIRHRLAALSSLFQYLCDKNAVTHNPVKGIKLPRPKRKRGKHRPAATSKPAKLTVSAEKSLKSVRDRAILATLLYHPLRREELCRLRVEDFKHERRRVAHLKISGKGGKTRDVPLHPAASGLILKYLGAAGHAADDAGALFRPVRNNRTGHLHKSITPDGVYKVVRKYSVLFGFEIGAQVLRGTAATHALDHQADNAKVQEWLGHANI